MHGFDITAFDSVAPDDDLLRRQGFRFLLATQPGRDDARQVLCYWRHHGLADLRVLLMKRADEFVVSRVATDCGLFCYSQETRFLRMDKRSSAGDDVTQPTVAESFHGERR